MSFLKQLLHGNAAAPTSKNSAVDTRPIERVSVENLTADSDWFSLPSGTMRVLPSPDATRVAYTVRTPAGQHVEVNGRAFPDYAEVVGVTFSSDSSRIAYAARRDGKWFVVVDHNEFDTWDSIAKSSPIMSPDAQHVGYLASRNGKWYSVVDREITGGPYDGVMPGGLIFSPDSQRTAFGVIGGNRCFIVVDKKEQKTFAGLLHRSWTFSSDSRRVAYWALDTSSANYGQSSARQWQLMVDSQPIYQYQTDGSDDDAPLEEIFFSPDSQRLASFAMQRGQWLLVLDGVPQRKFNGVGSGWYLTDDWKLHPDYGKAACKSEMLTFSPDSSHYVYAAINKQRNGHNLIYDGVERDTRHVILSGPIVFSPDSTRVAYAVTTRTGPCMVVDWRELDTFDDLPLVAPSFSPDSQHLAYIARKANAFLMVVDSSSCPLQGHGITLGSVVWDGPRRLHSIIMREQRIAIGTFQLI